MAHQLQLFVVDEPRTLIEAAEANKLLLAVTALQKVRVVPNGYGQFLVSDDGSVLDLSGLVSQVAKIVAQALNNSGAGAKPGETPGDLRKDLDDIKRRLDNASVTVSCQGGNVVGSLNL